MNIRLIVNAAVMAALIVCLCASAQTSNTKHSTGTTYYIDNRPGMGGDNSNSGISEKSPWFDFTPVNSHAFKPGDRILLARGASWNQQMTINDSGTKDHWCEIGAYGSGDRPKIIRSGDGTERGIRLNNPSYWKISGIEVGNAGVGIMVYYDTRGHEGLSFENIFVHDCFGIFILDMPDGPAKQQAEKDRIFLSAGIIITAAPPSGSTPEYVLRDIRFDNIEGTHNGDSIAVDPYNGGGYPASAFQNVTMNHLYLHDDDGPNPGGIPDALRFFSVKNVTMLNSILDRECGRWSSRGTATVFLCNVENLTFTNNMLIRNQDTKSYDQGAIDFEGWMKDGKIRNNYFGQNAGPGIEFLDIHGDESYSDNHEVQGNAFEGNGWAARGGQAGSGGIHHLGSNSANGVIKDNLFYEPGKPMFHGDFKNFKTENNIASTRKLYNSMNDFSKTAADNTWSYQYQLKNGAWKELNSYDAKRQVWVSGKGRSQEWIGRFEQCATKASTRTARVWKAPFSGRITIRGRALKSYEGGKEASVQITCNEKLIWGSKTIASNDKNGFATDIAAIDVSKGDLIRFESIGAAKSINDAVSWAPTIAYIDNIR